MDAGFAPAKVNLYLHVTGRRADGYHLLDSLAVFPAVGDVLRVAPGAGLSLAVEGPFAAGLAGEADNLVLRAARALGVADARMTLEKNLPIASGIGGGSSDAAAALRLLAPGKGADALAALAMGLGADVPVCLARTPARMQGVGEVLVAAPVVPDCGMVLVNPGVGVSTPAVFRARAPGFTPVADLPAGWADAAAMARDLAGLRNDLQVAAIGLCPAIADVLAALEALPGVLLARMSGSGATCFALLADAAAAAAAARSVARPGWWSWGGAVGVASGRGAA